MTEKEEPWIRVSEAVGARVMPADAGRVVTQAILKMMFDADTDKEHLALEYICALFLAGK